MSKRMPCHRPGAGRVADVQTSERSSPPQVQSCRHHLRIDDMMKRGPPTNKRSMPNTIMPVLCVDIPPQVITGNSSRQTTAIPCALLMPLPVLSIVCAAIWRPHRGQLGAWSLTSFAQSGHFTRAIYSVFRARRLSSTPFSFVNRTVLRDRFFMRASVRGVARVMTRSTPVPRRQSTRGRSHEHSCLVDRCA